MLLRLSCGTRDISDSIVVHEAGQTVTYPFDVNRARELYLRLLGPLEAEMAGVKDIIFEPDRPLLRLPPQVLIARQEGVDAYLERTEDQNADLYNYQEIDWLGRTRAVSIAVSSRGCLNIRQIAPSRTTKKGYRCPGSNALLQARAESTDPCAWALDTWRDPIDPGELYFAASKYGEQNSTVTTGQEFSDTALLAENNLPDYGRVHFASAWSCRRAQAKLPGAACAGDIFRRVEFGWFAELPGGD